MDRSGEGQMLQVRTDLLTGAVVITVDGEVDALTAPQLRAAVAAAFEDLDGRPLVLDLTGVTFLGSPGLQVLLDGADEALHHPGVQTLRLVVDHARPVVRPIELTGLDTVLSLFDTLPEALSG